jgi:hypothetical protein
MLESLGTKELRRVFTILPAFASTECLKKILKIVPHFKMAGDNMGPTFFSYVDFVAIFVFYRGFLQNMLPPAIDFNIFNMQI